MQPRPSRVFLGWLPLLFLMIVPEALTQQSQSKPLPTLPDNVWQSLSYWLALGLLFFGVYLLAKTILFEEQAHSAKNLLGDDAQENRKPASDPIIKYSRPVFSRYVVPVVQEMKLEAQRKDARRKLITSGLLEELTPDEYLSMRVSLVVLFPALLIALNLVGEFSMSWWVYVLSAPLGYYYPEFMIKNRIAHRQKLARLAMPFIIDLLALSTEAGLDFVGAIAKVAQKAKPSPLVDELNQVLKEMKLGSSRADAMKEMAVRLDMKEISSFISILISADEMGASIGKVLRQQSEQLRLDRTLAAEREGAKAASKILGPMFLFILPAIMITIFTPFLLQMMQGGGIQ